MSATAATAAATAAAAATAVATAAPAAAVPTPTKRPASAAPSSESEDVAPISMAACISAREKRYKKDVDAANAVALAQLHTDLYEDLAYTCGVDSCGACGCDVPGEDGPQLHYRLFECAACKETLCDECSGRAVLSHACVNCPNHDSVRTPEPDRYDSEDSSADDSDADDDANRNASERGAFRRHFADAVASPALAHEWEIAPMALDGKDSGCALHVAALKEARETIEPIREAWARWKLARDAIMAAQNPDSARRTGESHRAWRSRTAPMRREAGRAAGTCIKHPSDRLYALRTRDGMKPTKVAEERLAVRISTEKHMAADALDGTAIFEAVKRTSDGDNYLKACGCAVRCASCHAPHVCRFGAMCAKCVCAAIEKCTPESLLLRAQHSGVMQTLAEDVFEREF